MSTCCIHVLFVSRNICMFFYILSNNISIPEYGKLILLNFGWFDLIGGFVFTPVCRFISHTGLEVKKCVSVGFFLFVYVENFDSPLVS